MHKSHIPNILFLTQSDCHCCPLQQTWNCMWMISSLSLSLSLSLLCVCVCVCPHYWVGIAISIACIHSVVFDCHEFICSGLQ